MKVNGDWLLKTFPVVGGRLKIAHEANERPNIQTEIVLQSDDVVVDKAKVETDKGRFCGAGPTFSPRMSCFLPGLFGRSP